MTDNTTRIKDLENKIENAAQAMSETAPNWEARCHAIMAALGMDFGGYSEDAPDVGSWFEVTSRRQTARIEALGRALLDTAGSLAAALSLLKSGGKSAAPSDKMFAQMLLDYENSLNRARETLKGKTND